MENKKINARTLALDVLTRCESGGYSNIAIDTVIKRNNLSNVDERVLPEELLLIASPDDEWIVKLPMITDS